MHSNSHIDTVRKTASPRTAWSNRRIPLSHSDHLTGRVAYQLPPFGLDVESGLEGNVARALLALPNVIGLFSQPFTIFFDSQFARSRYTPDFLLVLGCINPRLARRGFERWTVIEVKTATRYQELRDPIETKLSLVRRVLGFATVCLTDADLEETLS